MKLFDWDPEKNQQLIEERSVSFEEVIFHLQSEGLLDDSVRLEQKAEQFDIDVTLDLWDEMAHGWQLSFQTLPAGQQAIERVGEYMRERWT